MAKRTDQESEAQALNRLMQYSAFHGGSWADAVEARGGRRIKLGLDPDPICVMKSPKIGKGVKPPTDPMAVFWANEDAKA